jgi:hypothetical protein
MTNRIFRLSAVAAIGLSGLCINARAADDQPSPAELKTQIEQLQKQISQLETRQNTQDQKLDKRDVDAAVNAVNSDADKRSQLMQVTGFTAGYDKGRFKLGSADGSFTLQPILYAQFRNEANYTQDTGGSNDSEIENGFAIRRARFGFDGNAWGKDFTYYFLWDANRDGGAVTLWQAWVRYAMGDTAIKLGQFVNPVVHEATTSSTKQLAVERSLADVLVFGTDEAKTQAVSFQYGGDSIPIGVEVGFEDGFASQNTDYLDTADNFGAFARVNWYVFGDHASYNDFTALDNKKDLLVFGAGVDFTQDGDANIYRHTVDAQWETGPVGLYAAFYGNYTDTDPDSVYNWGVLAQAGVILAEHWEPFARVDYTKFDNEVAVPGGTEDNFTEATVGVNYYFHGHNAKLTLDASWLPNGSPVDNTAQAIRVSGDDEWNLRAQFQLML